MAQSDKIQLFEDKRIRTAWDAEKEEWYFSIVDVVAVLTDSPNPQTYWRVLKKRLKDEGNETVTSCNALKMTAADGKRRLTGFILRKRQHINRAYRQKHQDSAHAGGAGHLLMQHSEIKKRHPIAYPGRDTFFYCHRFI